MANSSMNKHQGENRHVFSFMGYLVVISAAFAWYLYSYHAHVLKSLIYATSFDVFVFLWNYILLAVLAVTASRLLIDPIYLAVFTDLRSLGKKLEFYDPDYEHLVPYTKSKSIARFRHLIGIFLTYTIFAYFSAAETIAGFLQPIRSSDEYSRTVGAFFGSPQLRSVFGVLVLLFMVRLYFHLEGRTRLIFRTLTWYSKFYYKNYFYKKLSGIYKRDTRHYISKSTPFNPNSEDLAIYLFTVFHDRFNELTDSVSMGESWFELNSKSLRTNLLAIGPTGAGKTTSVAIPFLDQAIRYQSKNSKKKVSLIVYDPKSDLVQKVRQIATDCGRSKDIVELSDINPTMLNPLDIDNYWEGTNIVKVSGWVLQAWQHYQGKESPEPYWENQNFILISSIIPILLYRKERVTIDSLFTLQMESSDGCFKGPDNKITDFGKIILSIACSLDESISQKYSNHSFVNTATDFDDDILTEYSEDFWSEVGKYKFDRYQAHFEESKKVASFLKMLDTCTPDDIDKIWDKIDEYIWSEVENDVIQRWPKKDQVDRSKCEFLKITKSSAVEFLATLDADNRDDAVQTVLASCLWFLEAWSTLDSQTRGSIVTQLQPFFRQLQVPSIKRAFSPEYSDIELEDCISRGKIIVVNYSELTVGKSTSSAINSLIKSRWQESAISVGLKEQRSSSPVRNKVQVADEFQRIVSFGDPKGGQGDLDYCEISRSFGGISLFLTQGISSLKKKASKDADWEKMFGVVLTTLVFPTSDTSTTQFLIKMAGKVDRLKTSRTITEGSNNPVLSGKSEKFKSHESNLSIAHQESWQTDDRLHVHQISEAPTFTAVGPVFDGEKSRIMRVSFRPAFYEYKSDRYKLMEQCDFDNSKRNRLNYNPFFRFIRLFN